MKLNSQSVFKRNILRGSKSGILTAGFLQLVLLFFSCKSNQNTLYEFDPRTIKGEAITLSEIADDITYIPLDNKFPLNLIYRPRYFINKSIYLSALNSGVVSFDRNGKFIRKIGSKGRGPGEYNYCSKFTVDGKTETAYILDADIIKVYSKTGNYLRSIPLKEYGVGADAVEIFNSKLIISFPLQYNGIYDWVFLDTLGNLINRKERTTPPFKSNYGISGGMYKFENKIYYWSPYNDTVFSISSDFNYETAFLFSPGEHQLPKSEFNNPEEIKLFFKPQLVFETSHFLVLRYYFEYKVIIALIDKKSSKSYLSFLEPGKAVIGDNLIGGIFNDIDGGLQFQPENYYMENNREYMFGLINTFTLKALVAANEFKNSSPKYPEKKKDLEKLANSLTETDNQVLMIVRLKK